MIIRMYPTDGLKGQQANSPGQRPGYRGGRHRPEGAKALLSTMAFALSGRSLNVLPPRALPWADGSLPPSGRYRIHTDNNKK